MGVNPGVDRVEVCTVGMVAFSGFGGDFGVSEALVRGRVFEFSPRVRINGHRTGVT